MILPAIWIVAQSGMTKSLISSETPLFLAHSTFTGIVAADDWVPSAVIYPGIWFFKSWNGFFFPIAPETAKRATKYAICKANTHKNTFMKTDIIVNTPPLWAIFANVPKM